MRQRRERPIQFWVNGPEISQSTREIQKTEFPSHPQIKRWGIREKESPFHHLAFEPAQKTLENGTVKKTPEMLRGKVSCSQVAITVELFVYHIQLLCSFSGFNIAYYMYFLEAVITSHFHFDFTHPEFSYENYIDTKTCSCDYPFQAN